MIWLLRPDQTEATEFAPAMEEGTGILPGLPAVAGKPVHVGFDGGRLTSDGGILLVAAIEQRLKIAERLAACLEDPRDPDRVRHELAEMIRYRALLIAAGYPDGNDCDALKADPAFKMAVGRLPESGEDLCSQPTISRLENLPRRPGGVDLVPRPGAEDCCAVHLRDRPFRDRTAILDPADRVFERYSGCRRHCADQLDRQSRGFCCTLHDGIS